MRSYRSLARRARDLWRWGCGLLTLLVLAACGASTPPSAANTVFAAQTPATPATSAPATSRTSPAPADALVLAPSTPPTEPPAAEPSPTTQPTRPLPTPAAATQPPPTHQGWQIYRNDQAGYSVAYPPDWRVAERVGAPGEFIASFASKEGGAGIQVAVRPLDPEQHEPIDPPIARCKPITVGGASGMRCFDIVSLSVTTPAGKSKQFTISSFSKRLNPDIYQRFLDSFQILS